MNIPSHHQSSFFDAIYSSGYIDLEVRYFNRESQERLAEGWSSSYQFREFEKCVYKYDSPIKMLESVADAANRIHIISTSFCPDLVDFFCKKEIRWCHWSESPGIHLAELVGYRMKIFRILNPLMLLMKYREGKLISKFALGAFCQGRMAQKAFLRMGISHSKLVNLFYTPAALIASQESFLISQFAQNRRVFLSVSALCKRKGIDVLLKAFARLKNDDWCLVLCGLDKRDGYFLQLAKSLKIENRVLFLGAYPANKIAEVYSASDVFILPSRFDGWGAVLNEAASMGLPLIATDLCGASWHIIQSGINGYRVKSDSVESLSKAMFQYVQQPILIEMHGKSSKDIFLNDFTPEVNVNRLLKGLDILISQSKPMKRLV